MAFTDNADLFGSVNEIGINRLVKHIMRKRPSLFNYATAAVAGNRELWCVLVDFDPIINDSFFAKKKNSGQPNPIFTIENPLPIVGTRATYGIELGFNFGFQLSKAEIDFHPGKLFELPLELSPPLSEQHFAIKAAVCGGLGCPSKEILDAVKPIQPPTSFAVSQRPQGIVPLPCRKLDCFCLELFMIGHVEVFGTGENQRLLVKIDGLEIVDLRPGELESNVECYLNLLMQLVILPRVNTAVEKIILDIFQTLKKAPLTIVPSIAPKPPAILNNPGIEDDQLKLFIDLQVSP